MKHMLLMAAIVLATTTGGAQAQPCPDAPDHSAGIEALITRIQAAETAADARLISNRMWELWTDAPNEQAQAMLDRAMDRRRSLDYLGAMQDLNALVAFCPQYGEGYNQRAFINYLRQDYAAALDDLDRVIVLSPNHVAALAGRVLTLVGLGRTEEARAALAQALALNPWLPERRLAGPGGPLRPLGKDI